MTYKDADAQRRYQRDKIRYRTKVVARYKVTRGCDECGYDRYFGALEFHHLRDKRRDIGEMMQYSWCSIKAEMDKCMLLCSNCHREQQAGIAQW